MRRQTGGGGDWSGPQYWFSESPVIVSMTPGQLHGRDCYECSLSVPATICVTSVHLYTSLRPLSPLRAASYNYN